MAGDLPQKITCGITKQNIKLVIYAAGKEETVFYVS